MLDGRAAGEHADGGQPKMQNQKPVAKTSEISPRFGHESNHGSSAGTEWPANPGVALIRAGAMLKRLSAQYRCAVFVTAATDARHKGGASPSSSAATPRTQRHPQRPGRARRPAPAHPLRSVSWESRTQIVRLYIRAARSPWRCIGRWRVCSRPGAEKSEYPLALLGPVELPASPAPSTQP